MSKKMKVIFTLSFLLNIIVLGVLLGGVYKMKSWHSPHEISEVSREVLKKNIQPTRFEMRADFNKMKAYKKELKAVITAKEFNKEAFHAKVDQILEVKNNISKRKVDTLGQTLSELSQKDRKTFSGHVLGHLIEKSPRGSKGRKSMNRKRHLE